MRRMAGGAIAVGLTLALGILPAAAQKRGGDVVMAQQAQPPTLDAMTSSAQASRNVTLHIFEMLVTRDEKGNPIPDLAQKVDVSPDARTYVFTLRPGVKFHNGKIMTAADVKASLERYARVGGSASIMKPVAAIEATAPDTVTVRMSTAVPGFIDQISSPRAPAVVIPAEEAGKEAGKISLIGTGPYQFVEFQPDAFVKLKRFDDYVANPNYTKRDGFGGRKTPYFDTITIRFVPEGGARTAALQTGEVQILEAMTTPDGKRLASDKAVKVYEMMPWAFQTIMLNAAVPPTNNVKVREAMEAALDMEEIMAIASDGLYRMTHGWQHPGTAYFAGDVGKELYNRHDTARAKQLLAEAGYKGEPIVFMTDSAFKNHHDTAVVAAQQLSAIGMNIQLKETDWPTAFNTSKKAEGWNAWALGMGIEPYEGPFNVAGFFVKPDLQMKVEDPKIEEIYGRLTTSPKLEDRQKAFADFQAYMYQQFYSIKVGDIGIYQATRANVANYQPYRIPRMWDVWFE